MKKNVCKRGQELAATSQVRSPFYFPSVSILLFVLLFLCEFSGIAGATEIYVNTFDDELNSDTDCSLREAISAANTDTAVSGCPAGSGHDVIMLPRGQYLLTINGQSEDNNQTGDLDILTPMIVFGLSSDPGAVSIRANFEFQYFPDRVLDINVAAGQVLLRNLTIWGGRMDNGGGVRVVQSPDGLIMDSVRFIDNYAFEQGGGLLNSGTTILKNCSFDSNNSFGASTNCSTTPRGGGAIYNLSSPPGNLQIQNSLFDGNNADFGCGGAIFNEGNSLDSGGSVIITNSTFSNNTAASNGGALYNSGVVVDLAHCTVANNTCLGGSLFNENANNPIRLKNSMITGNSRDCDSGDPPGAFESLNYNLDSDDTCNLTNSNDQPATDPNLSANLAHNRFSSHYNTLPYTYSLPSFSPAVDIIPPADCTDIAGNPIVTDQRRYSRPAVGLSSRWCDIGAFELSGLPVIINEVDSDQGGSDTGEFIELYDGGVGDTPLDGYVLVAYDGGNDSVYSLSPFSGGIDLDGYSTDGSGYFLVGNAGLSPDIIINSDSLDDGVDCLALFQGNGSDFPLSQLLLEPPALPFLLDAIVYGNSDPNDLVLSTLTPGRLNVDENADSTGTVNSIQRCPNYSGGPFLSGFFNPFKPSPALDNYCGPPPVPDGFFGTAISCSKVDAAGSDILVSYDTSCQGDEEYALLYSGGSLLPSTMGGTYGLIDGECTIPASSPFTWNGSPSPSTDPSGFIWWVMVATDGIATEGSWGQDSAGTERDGAGTAGASNLCSVVVKDLFNTCQ